MHGICDYWYEEYGMAASRIGNDYVHKVVENLAKENNVEYFINNFYMWETTENDRTQLLPMLNSILKANMDYVVIQLGENISNSNCFESDYEELIKYIEKKCPKAKIISVGNFWENTEIDAIKEDVSVKRGISYVSLDDIQNDIRYSSKIGESLFLSNGQIEEVTHEGVANHPNDEGMKKIAIGILKALEKDN